MKQRSKKGFSLIELIVVIAVIAAIAAVIVPQFGNISGAARQSADQRNIQLWNEAYSNAYAMDQSTIVTGYTLPTALDGTNAPVLNVQYNVSGQLMNFYAEGFSLKGTGTLKFVPGEGVSK